MPEMERSELLLVKTHASFTYRSSFDIRDSREYWTSHQRNHCKIDDAQHLRRRHYLQMVPWSVCFSKESMRITAWNIFRASVLQIQSSHKSKARLPIRPHRGILLLISYVSTLSLETHTCGDHRCWSLPNHKYKLRDQHQTGNLSELRYVSTQMCRRKRLVQRIKHRRSTEPLHPPRALGRTQITASL